MRIEPINNVNFQAGNVKLVNINPKKLLSLEAFEKFAKDKNIDIFIAQSKTVQAKTKEKLFTVVASKDLPDVTRGLFYADKAPVRSAAFALINKDASSEEISVKIYNTVISAIENLQRRLSN